MCANDDTVAFDTSLALAILLTSGIAVMDPVTDRLMVHDDEGDLRPIRHGEVEALYAECRPEASALLDRRVAHGT